MLREKLEGEQDKNRPARQLLKDEVEEKVAPQEAWYMYRRACGSKDGKAVQPMQSLARFLYGLMSRRWR